MRWHAARDAPNAARARNGLADLAERLKICGGLRVPVVLILNEDFDVLSVEGDRTLSRYRALAARQLGPSCPLPGAPVPDDEVAATMVRALTTVRGHESPVSVGNWLGDTSSVGHQVPTIIFGPGLESAYAADEPLTVDEIVELVGLGDQYPFRGQ